MKYELIKPLPEKGRFENLKDYHRDFLYEFFKQDLVETYNKKKKTPRDDVRTNPRPDQQLTVAWNDYCWSAYVNTFVKGVTDLKTYDFDEYFRLKEECRGFEMKLDYGL